MFQFEAKPDSTGVICMKAEDICEGTAQIHHVRGYDFNVGKTANKLGQYVYKPMLIAI
jgi:hypothetical protein